jgi:hypothetical protein
MRPSRADAAGKKAEGRVIASVSRALNAEAILMGMRRKASHG